MLKGLRTWQGDFLNCWAISGENTQRQQRHSYQHTPPPNPHRDPQTGQLSEVYSYSYIEVSLCIGRLAQEAWLAERRVSSLSLQVLEVWSWAAQVWHLTVTCSRDILLCLKDSQHKAEALLEFYLYGLVLDLKAEKNNRKLEGRFPSCVNTCVKARKSEGGLFLCKNAVKRYFWFFF